MKKTVTKSYSIPVEIAKDIDKMAAELHISSSALITAALSVIIKWKDGKEVFTNGICRG